MTLKIKKGQEYCNNLVSKSFYSVKHNSDIVQIALKSDYKFLSFLQNKNILNIYIRDENNNCYEIECLLSNNTSLITSLNKKNNNECIFKIS